MPEEKRILRGLSKEEVEERFIEGFVNKTDISTEKSAKEIVKSNVFTYFNFIFLVITILLCVVFPEPDFPANHHRKYADWNYSGIAGEESLR